MPGHRVPVETPLITPYFPDYAEQTQTDSQDSLRALVSGDISAVFGGSNPYLQTGEEWPRCKHCQHTLVPYIQVNVSSERTPQAFREHVPPLQGADDGGATLFQLFICAAESDEGPTCFESWVVNYTDEHTEDSWLLRRVRVDAVANGVSFGGLGAHDAVRAALEEEDLLIPERVISGWRAGTPETVHWEVADPETFDQAFYDAHEPAEGLKLLGYPVQGKFHCTSTDDGLCAAGDEGPHDAWRCLIQLGTREDDNPIYTVGNMFVDQCAQHPDVFEAVCSGSW
ncbi:hypothetical protein BV20DRAFT_974197 [Pilatotrama ljubarskyi]|nr:hypothetical protein BV20DRAFT_974197 [Pilatotrama ljubarskyi]